MILRVELWDVTPYLLKKTHRMLAWGVLGSASDGLPFLLTHPVVFRSMYLNLTPEPEEVPSSFVKLCNLFVQARDHLKVIPVARASSSPQVRQSAYPCAVPRTRHPYTHS